MEDLRIRTTAEKEAEWLTLLRDETIKSVRPQHKDMPIPTVKVEFESGLIVVFEPKIGTYFEGCLINTLRKAQPLVDVEIVREMNTTYITLHAEHFPLLELIIANKTLPSQDFPFNLRVLEVGNA